MSRATDLVIAKSRSYSPHARLSALARLAEDLYVQPDLVNAYKVKMTQAGVAAPTVVETILNEVGTIVWTYSAPGVYIGTLAGAFANGVQKAGGVMDANTETSWSLEVLTDNTVQLTVATAGTPTDELLSVTAIDFEVIA